jgi:hypothetical protein
LMLFLNPWIYFMVNIYSIATWNTRSWGGPRTAKTQKMIIKVESSEPLFKPEDTAGHKTSVEQVNATTRGQANSIKSFGSNDSDDFTLGLSFTVPNPDTISPNSSFN